MKKITAFLLVCIVLIAATCFMSSAAFTSELPDYVNLSGGAWFEVYDSALGRCTVIFPVEFKDNIFGFKLSDSGLPSDIVNFSNSTVYGTVFTSDGSQYACRVSRFSTIEYQTTSSYNQYVALSPDVVSLGNSNMLFLTDDTNYINDTVPDYQKYFLFIFTFIGFCEFISVCANLVRRGRR